MVDAEVQWVGSVATWSSQRDQEKYKAFNIIGRVKEGKYWSPESYANNKV
jgi:hypothetical protein